MKKGMLFIGILLFVIMNSFGQEKPNPIVYSEMYGGYSGGSSEGWIGGLNINYQIKDNLITGRYLGLTKLKHLGNYLVIPVYVTVESINEFALLYGKRFVHEGHSMSYSAGIAYVDREFMVNQDYNNIIYDIQQSVGFPFEVNIKWFKNKKERFRAVYGLIPIGKPTSFGRSVGFKFYGDISKTTFIVLGFSYGFGWHKNY